MNNTSAMSLPAMENGMSPIKPIRFIGVCILSFVLIVWLPESVFAPLNHATAYLAGLCLALFGNTGEVAGDLFSLNGFRVLIITECTALYSIILFGGFIFSAPASLKSRLVGLLAGIPFLVTVNTLRIALITMIGARYPALFEAAHVYLAQVVMMILVVASSFIWLRMATRSEEMMNIPFLMRAFAMASIIFLPWLILNETYMKALDYVTAGIFALAGYRLMIPYGNLVYFQTFNTVLFLALIFAERRLSPRRKAAWALVGVTILAAEHLLFRVGNVMLTAFSWQPALRMTMSLSVIGEYLLPLFLWLAATRAFKTTKD
jgi:exosortase H (IPTLxxWG-CTERM-specific)